MDDPLTAASRQQKREVNEGSTGSLCWLPRWRTAKDVEHICTEFAHVCSSRLHSIGFLHLDILHPRYSVSLPRPTDRRRVRRSTVSLSFRFLFLTFPASLRNKKKTPEGGAVVTKGEMKSAAADGADASFKSLHGAERNGTESPQRQEPH